MQLVAGLSVLLHAASLVAAESRTVAIFLQPVTSAEQEQPPSLLAEVRYEAAHYSSSDITNYEAPELPEDTRLVRIGVYDPKTSRWVSSTSVTSVENFSKGYSPHFALSVGLKGELLGVACRGVKIDAGHTREFGPQSLIVVTKPGKQPELNKPVVLSPEGRRVQPLEEKTFLQKYYYPIYKPPYLYRALG
jgi:hypothetical protein